MRIACVGDGPGFILQIILMYFSAQEMVQDPEFLVGVPADATPNKWLPQLLQLPNVHEVKLPEPLDCGDGKKYRIINKVNLMNAVGDLPCLVCDSDILFVRRFPTSYLEILEVGAKVADATSWNGNWPYVYRKFGFSVPKDRVVTTTTKEISFPYYNSGFVWTKRPDELGASWKYATEAIALDHNIDNRFPYSDQISFPIALRLSGLRISELDVAFNQSIHAINGNYYILHHHAYYEKLQKAIPALLAKWSSRSPLFAEALTVLSEKFSRE